MAEALITRRWAYRGLYVLVSIVVIGIDLLPLGDGTAGFPGPDLTVVIAYAWVLRRPDYVTPLLLAVVVLLADAFALRPLGLWAALVVMGAEFLRTRESLLRDLPFLAEWALVTSVLLSLSLAYWAILSVFIAVQPELGQHLLRALASALVYPVVVAISRTVFGLRRVAPGEVDALGHRL
jgi:rod shape-determining protein MreD